MRVRWIAWCAVLLDVGACGNLAGPGDIAGLYDLKTLDGDVLPTCCNSSADSGMIVAGELELGASAGDNGYVWRMARADVHGYEVRLTQVVFSSGTYASRGQELTLWDSSGLGRIAGVITGDLINVTTSAHRYEFARRSPASIVGQYAMLGCWDASGGSPGCPETDSAGTVVTIVGGRLQLGFNVPHGRYDWDVTRKYQYRNGTSELIGSRFSVGTYDWDGRTLALVDDSGHPGPITGTFTSSGAITLVTEGRRYDFGKLVLLPPGR